MNTTEIQNNIFPKGERAPADYFTGTVWVKTLVQQDSTFNFLVASVTFEPGARNNWHTHPAGQILLVTDGIGYYQEKGKPIQLLHKGDVVNIPPDIVHWHGASAGSRFTHIAISMGSVKGVVEWLGRVTDEEYNSFK